MGQRSGNLSGGGARGCSYLELAERQLADASVGAAERVSQPGQQGARSSFAPLSRQIPLRSSRFAVRPGSTSVVEMECP